MSRHAKAPSAGSTEGHGSSRGLIRRAFAAPAPLVDAEGIGARPSRRPAALLATLVLAIAAAALTAAPASAAPASATVGSISAVSYASAHVEGTVHAVGETFWRIDYSTDEVSWTEGAASGGPVTSDTPIEADIGGLKGGTKYFVRIGLYNGENSLSADPNPDFTTLPVAPPVVLSADDASQIGYTGAKVSGQVKRPVGNSDHAFDVNCRFEYVTDQQFTDNEANSLPPFEGAASVDCAENPITEESADADGKQSVEAHLSALTPATTYHFRLAASNAGGSDVLAPPGTFTTLVALRPDVSITQIDVGATNAKVSWDVNPRGTETSTFLEFSGDGGAIWYAEPYGVIEIPCHAASCLAPSPITIGEGTSPVSVERVIPTLPGPFCPGFFCSGPPGLEAGLEPNTGYLVRIRATNAGGETLTDPPQSFKTETAPPSVRTLGLNSIAAEQAILAGQVNPRNSAVTYEFEWGPQEGEADGTYEHHAPASPQPLGAVDNSFHPAVAPISGLNPDSRYHYRILATNTETGEVVEGADRAFTSLPAPGAAPSCPNEASRVGPSAGLPDCRAYEWVSPDSNNVYVEKTRAAALADGTAIQYFTQDVAGAAEGASVGNRAVSRRGPDGWAAQSFSPPAIEPVDSYYGQGADGAISADFTEAIVYSPQPLAGPSSPTGQNIYLRRADGTFVPISLLGEPLAGGTTYQSYVTETTLATPDFSHVYFKISPSQLPSDPLHTTGFAGFDANTYEWDEGVVRLLGILPGPDQTPAPLGVDLAPYPPKSGIPAVRPAFSDDGRHVLFQEMQSGKELYLRIDGQESVEVSASQRTVDPDLNPTATATSVGISADGSRVLFLSSSALTNDANTGEVGGVAADVAPNLYSYDVGSEVLTDLTVAEDPEDEARGADVTAVVGTNPSVSHVYFIAAGKLAPGAVSGEPNLYVEHEGSIDFISPAAGLARENTGQPPLYVTPDGLHAAFVSTASLTGYDNTNPSSGTPEGEVYKYTYKEGLECASCRLIESSSIGGVEMHGRVISDDGSRVFFTSADRVVPQASNGLMNVYQYENGEPRLLSPGDAGVRSYLLDASASGDDVFISTYGELTPGSGTISHIFDARVNADVARPVAPKCQGEGCRGGGSSAPGAQSPGSSEFESLGEVTAPKLLAARAKTLKLRITVPESGQVIVSGKGIKTVKKNIAKAGPVVLALALKPDANKTRLKKGVFETKAQILFKPKVGSLSRSDGSRPVVSLKFEGPTKKGGK